MRFICNMCGKKYYDEEPMKCLCGQDDFGMEDDEK